MEPLRTRAAELSQTRKRTPKRPRGSHSFLACKTCLEQHIRSIMRYKTGESRHWGIPNFSCS